jgi:molecular chaperone GrpE
MNEELEIPEDLGAVDEIADQDEEETQDIATLREELEKTKERVLRIAADAENYKKRMEREKEKMLKYAGENILRELLPTVDNLERAMEQGRAETGDAGKQLEALLEGVDLTYKGLLSVLEKFNVQPIESVGREFNPDEMDALTMEASETMPVNHVLREFAKGYRFKDRVLRHAQVVVSSGRNS